MTKLEMKFWQKISPTNLKTTYVFPVTDEEIRLHFPEGIRDTIKATRITDLLKKSGRDQLM